MVAPSPFQPIGSSPLGQQPMPMMGSSRMDQQAAAAMIANMLGADAILPQPIYRPGYKPPKKPDPSRIAMDAKDRFERDRMWRMLVSTTLNWTRQELTGMFPEDEKERRSGFQEQWVSSALSDERNLIIAKGASLKPSFCVPPIYGEQERKGAANLLADAAVRLWELKKRFHARGNRPLQDDQWALLADYGMYASRTTFVPDDPSYPLDTRLMDPASISPVWGGRYGLEKLYRYYRCSLEEVTQTYGDLAPTVKTRLENKFGKMNPSTDVTVTEYWDTWWRSVQIDDQEILPVTAHQYGEVPWTIQYGGNGEPTFTRNPYGKIAHLQEGWVTLDTNYDNERMYKAVPLIFYRIHQHEILESVMARVLTGFKKEIFPPYLRYRSNEAAEKEMPQLDLGPGQGNEAMLGEEEIQPLEQKIGPATNLIVQGLMADRQTGAPPSSMYGQVTKSNVSGTAMNAATDAGMDKISPTIRAWELANAHEMNLGIRLIRNFGHLAEYGSGQRRPFMIPVRKPRQGMAPALPLDRQTIDLAGAEIEVHLTSVDPKDWPALFSGGKLGVDLGILTRAHLHEIATGDYDFDRHFEEWAEEQGTFSTLTHPKFAEMFGVPMALLQQMKEQEGNPEMQKMYLGMLAAWFKNVVEPSQQQQQAGPPGQSGGPASPMPPQGPPGGSPAPMQPQLPQARPGIAGGAGMPYQQMGQGPGSLGAPIGRPGLPGPQGLNVGP